MHSKLIGLLIISLISCGFAQVQIVQISSLAGCSGTTCSIGSLTAITALTGLLGTGFGLNFTSQAFVNSQIKTVNIDPYASSSAGLTGGLYINSGVAATFVLQTASTTTSTITVGVAQGASSAISVGSQATLQIASNTQAQGNVVVDGTLTLAASAATSAQATLAVSGSLTTSSSAQSSSSSNTNSAINIQSSNSLTVSGSVNLLASVNVAANAFLTFASSAYFGANVVVYGAINSTVSAATYTQSQATLTLQEGAVAASSVVIDGSSTLAGNGNIYGSLTVQATSQVSVGNSPGTVTVNGDYNMGATSKFNLQIASQTSYDRLIITGTANLNGFLVVETIDNYTPSNGNTFNFMTHKARTGKFSSVAGSTTSDLTKFNANYDSSTITSVTYTNSAAAVAVSFTVMLLAVLVTLL